MSQHVVMTGLLYRGSKDMKEINDYFKERGWGKLKYKTQFKTLRGFGGEGGRSDVVFEWSGTQSELGLFSVERLMMGENAPRWLEDYIDNNKSIIPGTMLNKLEGWREW